MSEATDPVNIVYQLKRAMQNQMDALVQTIASGGVDSMEEYKYIIGKIHGIDAINQELSNLLDNKELNESKGTVININGSKPKDNHKYIDTIHTMYPIQ